MKLSLFDNESQFESFIKSIQYIMRLTLQQDIYKNFTRIIRENFNASWVAFVSFNRQEKKYVYYGTTPKGSAQFRMPMDAIEKTVTHVLENGFLTIKPMQVPRPAQVLFLPLRELEANRMALIIAHTDRETLPNNLINTYLALGELASTAIELRKHKNSLEGIIFERTKEIESVNNLLKQVNEQNTKELVFANTFQASLMPSVKKFDMADMYGKYIPCSMVGGDLYDCVQVGDSLWFIIADVAGHGLVAAMISTMLKGMFNECLGNFTYPNEILQNMNAILYKTQSETDPHLVSAFIGVIRGNKLFYSNAGHFYPIIINSEEKSYRVIRQNGYLLGIESDTNYTTEETKIDAQEMVLLYTDGFINQKESEDYDFEDIIGEYSIIELESFKKRPQIFIKRIVDSLRRENENDFEDDVSIMVINKK